MKQRLLASVFLLFASFVTYAQNNELEAKAAYLLADEKYGKGEVREALQYLKEAEAKLGAPNSKILYLKVMIVKGLSDQDRRYLPKLDSVIAVLEKLPDFKTFNEDKALEVMKIKLELKKKLEQLADQKSADAKIAAAIKQYESSFPDWVLGTSFEEIQLKHPIYFDKKTSPAQIVNNDSGTHYVILSAKTGTSLFGFHNNKLFRYREAYFNYDDDNAAMTKYKASIAPVLADFKAKFGYLPDPKIDDNPANKSHAETYTWKDGQKTIWLMSYYVWSDASKTGYSSCFSEIIDYSI